MGLGNDIAKAIFSPIKGFFEGLMKVPPLSWIKDILDNVANIPKSIEYIINFFKCPLNILNHIETCMGYYLIDVFLYIIYLILIVIPFGLIYCVILLPIIAVLNIVLPLVGLGRINLTFSDICPFKNTFGKYLEFAIYKSNNKYFFYRTGSDIDKCYCTSGIKGVFNPLQEIFSIPKDSMGGGGGATQLFVFALIITGILLIPGNKTELPVVSVASPIATPIPTYPIPSQ